MNPNDDEKALFLKSMKDVKPLEFNKQSPLQKSKDLEKEALSYRRQYVLKEAKVLIPMIPRPTLSYSPEDKIAYFKPGFSEKQKKRFIRGEIPPNASLDLHGLSIEEANQALYLFFAEAERYDWRCVKVIHGKGNQEALLKNSVIGLLESRSDSILAYHSCSPRQGGTGALIILLAKK